MLCLGLTGPTGAGKSMVATLFASQQIPIIDADGLYHHLLANNKSLRADLMLSFGKEIVQKDGSIDRKALGKIVFNDAEKLKRLNAITHPYVVTEICRELEKYRLENTPIVILDAPTLFESGLNTICGFVISVIAREDIRLARIMKRDNITEEAGKERMHAGRSVDFFKQHSDFIIENNSSLEELYVQVSSLVEKIKTSK